MGLSRAPDNWGKVLLILLEGKPAEHWEPTAKDTKK